MGVKSFNSADLNNIAKKDGRYNVIENISGAKRTLNPPAAAYSVRKLTGLTGVPYDGPAMRILVDATGDGADATDLEFDINFTADGDLDVADIELKCTGGKDAYVVKWYDQSGAGNDATQTAYASMPKICSAGAVITQDGKPALDYDGAQSLTLTTRIYDASMSVFCVWKCDSDAISNDDGIYSFSDTDRFALQANRYAVNQLATRHTGATSIGGTTTTTDQNLTSHLRTGSTATLHANGSALTTTVANANTNGSNNSIGVAGSALLSGYVWELVAYAGTTNGDQSSNRPTIENNINSYFNIYQSRENILPGAAAAYSLRQLSDSSRLAVRVRRDTGVGSGTDDDEADVGFDVNGEVSLDSPVSNFDPTGSSATTLGEFLADAAYDDEDSLGAPADGFVTAWYDQSVNANNATQATPDAQPKIYDSSTGLIKENGKPALDWDGTDDVLVTTYSPTVTHTAFFVQVPTTNVVGFLYSSTGTFTNRFWVASTDVNQLQMYRGGSVAYSEGSTLSGQYLGYALNKATTTDIRLGVNGSNVADTGNIGSAVVTNIRVGAEPNSGFYGDSRIQELIIYDSDNSSNRTDIEGNINAHYGIANIGTPSSGLLADYPGSAAAYSVRKLADTASLAMRIIVDDTAVIGTVDASDTEYDIGFDANGDLDVARIREVCNNPSGANYNAYVVTWYDQSGNGNHATQATYTSCPQIYDGVDVIMENGKPAIGNWINQTSILIASFGTTHNDVHVFSVSTDNAGSAAVGYIVSGNTSTNLRVARNTTSSDIFLYDGASAFSTTNQATGQALISATNETTPTVFFNGSARSFNNTLNGNGMSGAYIGNHPQLSNGASLDGNMQELIIFSAHQSTDNRKAIETDIDSYYRIYGDPDDGLLSTPYGKGAAAAYSVRRLSNNATRAMRILVDADANGPDASDNEYDIGFDVNGELDIARIEELCDKGTGNYDAYVTTWYDQSGEGNDAAQTAYASMPKICDAGTVILENGKPSVTFSGATFMIYPTWSPSSELSAFWVSQNEATISAWTLVGPNSNQWAPISTSQFRTRISNFYTWNWSVASGAQYLAALIRDVNDDAEFHYNGNTSSTTRNFTDTVTLNQLSNATNGLDGGIQEVVFWSADQSSNRTLIEANINDYFNIEGV